MRKLLCVVGVLCASIHSHALNREAFTFTKYDLNVRVEPEQQRIGVRGKITLRNDSTMPQRSLSLQISSSLNWSSIKLAGAPVEFLTQPYISDIDHTGTLSEAIVVLPQPVAPKQSVELEIGYEGIIQQDATRLTRIGVPVDKAKHADWDEIGREFSAVRGIGYVAWYPVAEEAASLSDEDAVPDEIAKWSTRAADTEFDVNLCVLQNSSDTNAIGLMNDDETAAPRLADAARDTCAVHRYAPLRQRTPIIAIGNYSVSNLRNVDVYFSGNHKSGADDYASAVDEVTPPITRWFGDHRENKQLKSAVVDLSDPQAAAYESGDMLLMPLSGSDTKMLLSAAQQLTHLFFPSPHIWIHDGLASYAQARFIEEKEGRQAAIAYLQAHESGLIESEKETASNGGEHRDRSLINTLDRFRLQTKAMYVWWMLRDIVGESSFDSALRQYKAADDNSPTYMQKIIEAQAHRDLQWFFDDWVYHDRGLPDLRIASVYPSKLPSGGYMVTVTVENLGAVAAEVPVTLHLPTTNASERLLIPGKSKASLRIETPSMPQIATVNDGSVPESDMNNNEYKIESLNH
jgi:hypothetical protein